MRPPPPSLLPAALLQRPHRPPPPVQHLPHPRPSVRPERPAKPWRRRAQHAHPQLSRRPYRSPGLPCPRHPKRPVGASRCHPGGRLRDCLLPGRQRQLGVPGSGRAAARLHGRRGVRLTPARRGRGRGPPGARLRDQLQQPPRSCSLLHLQQPDAAVHGGQCGSQCRHPQPNGTAAHARAGAPLTGPSSRRHHQWSGSVLGFPHSRSASCLPAANIAGSLLGYWQQAALPVLFRLQTGDCNQHIHNFRWLHVTGCHPLGPRLQASPPCCGAPTAPSAWHSPASRSPGALGGSPASSPGRWASAPTRPTLLCCPAAGCRPPCECPLAR